MIKIDVRKAITALSEAVAEKGSEYIYQPLPAHGCVYVHFDAQPNPQTGNYEKVNLEPGCLVGNALIRLGVPAEAFFGDGENHGSINEGMDALGALLRLEARGILEFDNDVDSIFQAAQNVQDDQKSWGLALNAAKAKACDLLIN